MTQAKSKTDRKAGLTPGQTIWYTKYALTDGRVTEAKLIDALSDCTYAINIEFKGFKVLAFANEWHTTKEAADKQVLKMCAAKRKSIQKQLDKITAIENAIQQG